MIKPDLSPVEALARDVADELRREHGWCGAGVCSYVLDHWPGHEERLASLLGRRTVTTADSAAFEALVTAAFNSQRRPGS